MNRPLVCAISVLSLVLVACQTTRMGIADELAGADRLAVAGRQGWKISESLAFGPYRIVEIRRSWTTSRDESYRVLEGGRQEQRFSFVLTEDGEEQLGGSCRNTRATRTVATGVVDVEFSNQSSLYCSLFPSREAARDWELRLESSGDRPLGGVIQVDEASYRVTGTRKLAGPLPAERTSGYEIAAGGTVVAAVEVIGNGAVVLAPHLKDNERALMATAAGALLLAEDLRMHISE